MTEGLVPVGMVAHVCPDCPWPVHLSLLGRREDVDAGIPLAVDVETAEISLALRVHARQHDGWPGADDGPS